MVGCTKCGEPLKALRLVKCVICFKMICERCAVRLYAKHFCSEECASVFYMGTGEEYEDPV